MAESQSKTGINTYIDYTLLKADTSKADIEKLCFEAAEYGFHGVCVPPYFVALARQILTRKKIKVSAVIGFPMGYSILPVKAEELKRALADGADEADVVINIAAVKSANWTYVKEEIESLTTICRMHGKIIKLILETSLMTDQEIERLCEICIDAKVNFVKNSTGFLNGKATVEEVKRLKSLLPSTVQIKAAGGIRTYHDAAALIASGANRLGTSAGIEIVRQSK